MQYKRLVLVVSIISFSLLFLIPHHVSAEGPAGIDSGLKLWFSATNGVKKVGGVSAINGDIVQTWEDQSLDARTATKQDVTGATYSTTGLNYNPTLEFNNNNYTFSDTGLPSGSTDRSIFVVASTNDIGNWRYVLGAGTYGSDNGFDFGNQAGSGQVFITTHSAQEAVTGSWEPLGTARLAYGSVTGGALFIAVNGEGLVAGGTGVNTVLDGNANIGANSGGVELWNGSISEVIMFNRSVSNTERQRINSYLALKYGFSLDQTTPQSYLASGSALMWDKDASGASTYSNGLFGIGRDDASHLAQIKSRGQTSTNIIVLNAVDEGINGTPDFHDISNLEFLVIGDNAGSSSWTTTGAPSGYSVLTKKWKKQEQGDVGPVTLDFDVADSDFNVPAPLDADDYYFIYDTDNDDSLADETPVAMSDQGGNLWRTTVDFGSGGLFSLASTENPAISSLSPADNATSVAVNSNLVLTLSKNVTVNTGSITIKKSSDDSLVETISVVSGQVTGSGTSTITINPSNNLAGSTGYYVQIDATALKDGSNNFFGGIDSKEAWNFSTEASTSEPTSVPSSSGNSSSTTTNVSASPTSCTAQAPTMLPDLFQIDASNNQARVYFTPLTDNVTNYYVSYGYKPGEERFGIMTGLGTSKGVLTYMINELSPNSTYYVKIKPYNSCMPGNWSNEMKITTVKGTAGTKYYKNFLARVFSLFPKHVTEVKPGDVLGSSTKKSKKSSKCEEYVVKSGDTLWKIAAKTLGSGAAYSSIVRSNKLNSNVVNPGQRIKVGC